MNKIGKRIEKLLDLEKWSVAERIIKSELRVNPNDHWLLTRLSTIYYEQRKYKTALRIVKKALKLASNCPLVLWDYAGTLGMMGYYNKALKIYKRICDRDVKSIAYGECGEGLDWAKSLLNDCLYRMALCYKEIGNVFIAMNFYKKYINNRATGISSIYNLRKIKTELSNLQRQHKQKQKITKNQDALDNSL